MAAPPQRIVSLAPNVTEVLYELGLGDRIVAVSTYCNYPPEARTKPKIGGMSNPSLEAVVALQPDMVVLTDDGNPRLIAKRLTKLKIRTYVFRAKRLYDISREIKLLGVAVGKKDKAALVSGRIESKLKKYAEKGNRSFSGTPQRVLFIVQAEPLMAAGPGTAIDDILKLLGQQNIAADAPRGYPRLSIEEVIRRSPDIIFMVKTRDGMSSSDKPLPAKLTSLEAVRHKHVYYVGDPLLRMGPRITEGIDEIARHLERSRH